MRAPSDTWGSSTTVKGRLGGCSVTAAARAAARAAVQKAAATARDLGCSKCEGM